jgi:hypothetical protein
MPVKSAKQFGLMEAASNGKSASGPSPEVAREFLNKTTHTDKSKFAKALMKNRKKK